jgi:ABC-type uncharacterized transport system auxiliary subunit
MMRSVPAIAGAILGLFSAACVGGRPIHYYTINHATVTIPAAKPDGFVLVIGRITAPETLQDSRIRYRTGGNEVGAYEYHRWTERPGLMVQELLLESLRASGKYRQVQESSSAVVGDYVIRGKLHEFSEIDGEPRIQTRVSMHVELLDRKSGLVIWDRQYNRDEPVNGKIMKDVVRSMEQNLHQVVADATSGIEMFLSSRSEGANR